MPKKCEYEGCSGKGNCWLASQLDQHGPDMVTTGGGISDEARKATKERIASGQTAQKFLGRILAKKGKCEDSEVLTAAAERFRQVTGIGG